MSLKNIKNKIKGFTIVEALVSVAVILFVIIGPLSLTIGSLNTLVEYQNKIVASYLAEEIIEDFKNYRDDYSLACAALELNYDFNTSQLNSMDCGEISVPESYYNNNGNDTIPPDTNPRNIAWKLFLNNILGDINNTERVNLLLDNESFNFSSQNFSIYSEDICEYLSVSEVSGYKCISIGNETLFHRVVNIIKISPDLLKVEVIVDYTKSNFLSTPKSVYIVDYIYKR